MGFFDLLKKTDINEGVVAYKNTKNAVLLDVRSAEEYAQGHIPGSRNIDVQSIKKAKSVITDLQTPLFVYCHSGARSSSAVSVLKSMGYTNVNNIGGIMGYAGKDEGDYCRRCGRRRVCRCEDKKIG